MEGTNVIVLEIDFDERLPVDRIFMGYHPIEHIAGKVQVGEHT